MPDAIRSRRILLDGRLKPAVLELSEGRIKGIRDYDYAIQGSLEDYQDLVIMPGLVDTHVHINEPGRTDWEGFETASQAAAAGGITTLVDMPLNCIPVTTSAAAFSVKLEALGKQLSVDCGFWGGLVPDHINDLPELLDSGVLGVKAFLIHSGIDDFPQVSEADLRRALPLIKKSGKPLLVHAELDLSKQAPSQEAQASTHYKDFLDSRPGKWEYDAIDLMIRLCRETGCRVHIVHLSYAGALPLIRAAKAEGLPLSVETCSHYLCLHAEEVPEGNTRYKCAPPIREKENADLLWEALRDGTLDFVVSDHSPCTPELKRLDTGDFTGAWGGVSSVQFGLPVVWTEARKRGFGLADISRLMSANTANFAGLGSRKGKIEVAYDADFVVWDPDESFVLNKSDIRYKNKMSPYEGFKLQGVVKASYVRGQKVFQAGKAPFEPLGRPIIGLEGLERLGNLGLQALSPRQEGV